MTLQAILTAQAQFLAQSPTCPVCYQQRDECNGEHE